MSYELQYKAILTGDIHTNPALNGFPEGSIAPPPPTSKWKKHLGQWGELDCLRNTLSVQLEDQILLVLTTIS